MAIKPVGYFKIWRELFEKPIWLNSTPEQKTVLITVLAMANYAEKSWEWGGKPYKCQPGQFVTSLAEIAKAAGKGVAIKNVRTSLERFEKLEFLANESAKTGRLITIANWELYQSDDEKVAKQQAKTGQRPGKQVANHRAPKEEVRNKEVKNKDMRGRFTPPTLDEVTLYCQERNNGIDPQRFVDFYTAKGWMVGKNKMKDWKAAIRGWEARNDEKKSEAKATSSKPNGFHNFEGKLGKMNADELDALINKRKGRGAENDGH